MPAASAEKRARQRANKIQKKEAAAATCEIMPADQNVEITTAPALWPTPAPASFTISYTPVTISYPEPMNSKAKLPTDAIRVTRDQLSIILHQSYIHGSEHGWKANVDLAKDCLQAEYEEDMRNSTTKFQEHEKQIREEEFNRGFEDGSSECTAQLAALRMSLITKYDLQHLETLEHFSERCQEEHDQGYKVGYDTGIREGKWPELTTATVSVQTDPPTTRITPSATVSTQTDHNHLEKSTSVTAAVQTTPSVSPIPPHTTASTQTSSHDVQPPVTADNVTSSSTTTATSLNTTTNDKNTVLAPTTTISIPSTPSVTSTPLLTTKITRKCSKTATFNQNHPKTPKPAVLDENTMKIQPTASNGTPFNPATTCDEGISRVESPFPPIHETAHHPVATSPLSALTGYVSSTKTTSAFENHATDVALKLATPVVATYEPSTPTVNASIPENATTTGEFSQNHPETPKSPISDRSKWSDDAELLPAPPKIPTKYPRDLSDLYSSSPNPFYSLRRRHRNQRNLQHFINFRPQSHCQYYCHHNFLKFHHYHSSFHLPYHPSQPPSPFSDSLNWDQDPRLLDLSDALRALGWTQK
jgi:hypothetical protein